MADGNGEQRGIALDYITEREDFNIYLTHDGWRIKVKWVLTAMRRMPDERGRPVFEFKYERAISIERA